MTVFNNRIRQAYIRRRARRKVAAAGILLVVVAAVSGIAAAHAEWYAQATLSSFVGEERICVVDWADTVPVFEGRGR